MWAVPMLAVAIVLVVVAGVEAGVFPGEQTRGPDGRNIRSVNAAPASFQKLRGGSQETSGKPLNILVLGVDRRPDSEQEGGGVRSDTIMLVRISPDTGGVKLLSIPRDLLVEIKPGEENRINAAYSFGGINETIPAVENYTGIPIDHYAIVDFEGFASVIDAMGGVQVDVKGQFPATWHMDEGVKHLNGRRALMYARYRGTPDGDLGRIARQQQMVAALRSQALKWNTVKKLPEIATTMNKNITTDMGLQDAISLGQVLIKQGRHATMTSAQLQGTPKTMPNGDEVLKPDRMVNERILQQFRD